MKKTLALILSIVMIIVSFTGCTGSNEEVGNASKKKIAFITGTGGLGDKSFNDLGYEGIKLLEKEGIECDVAEPKAISEIEGILRSFAETGEYALLIGMGGETGDSFGKVALDYPEYNFMVIDSEGGKDNYRTVSVDQNETGFLIGAYVGLMKKDGNLEKGTGNNVIGAVGGMDIPLIRGILTGYECGARYVNPDIEVLTAYVGAWNDPGKGSELTQGMYEQGADIVLQAAGSSGMGVIEAAQKKDLYAVGYDGNQNVIAPENVLGSAIRGVGEIVYQAGKEALEGSFEGGNVLVKMQDNVAASQVLFDGVATEIPESVLENFEKIKEVMAQKGFSVPAEPEMIEAFLEQLGEFEE